jgi:hypothetical protein
MPFSESCPTSRPQNNSSPVGTARHAERRRASGQTHSSSWRAARHLPGHHIRNLFLRNKKEEMRLVRR